ncbi:MAG: tetratricopeptide repeat protein [Pirellulales bacterium]|nr:tetratricopeptide repeat protein [Pirellulales bacterium]
MASTADGASSLFARVGSVVKGMGARAAGRWLRTVIIAGTVLVLIGVTVGGWAYLASVALTTGEPQIEDAMEALDKGDIDEARSIVSHLLTSGRVPRSEYGGPLFILGAVKVHEAAQQAVPTRRQVEFMIASRYLAEARAYGLPPVREAKGYYFLGQSLIESGQFEEGVLVLNELVGDSRFKDRTITFEAQWLLVEACLLMPHPREEEALRHNDSLIAHKSLSEKERVVAHLQRAECFSRLERFEEARQVLDKIPAGDANAGQIAFMQGKVTLDEIEANLRKLSLADGAEATKEMTRPSNAAIANLDRAGELSPKSTQLASMISYQKGRAFLLQGETDQSLRQFQRTRQYYADSYEGLAASLGEAKSFRLKGEYEDAILAYRRTLEAFAAIPVYRSPVLPVERFREELMVTNNELLEKERFGEALALAEHLTPLFTQAEKLEIRSQAFERWGTHLMRLGAVEDSRDSQLNLRTGRKNLRAAGLAFEQLAEKRFASKDYASDLWRASEDYFQGQCYSRAVQAITKYLQYEPELRNAQALLLLGQSQLAMGKLQECVGAFEECIEFHPLDPATSRARIDCAKAYLNLGNVDRAEALLRENIAGSMLKPMSPEWRDSLFELGMLLQAKEEFEEAIISLEDAVERYPEDPRILMAQYLIGECYRRQAQVLMEETRNSHLGIESQKAQQQAALQLNAALRQFEFVQKKITLQSHDIDSDPLLSAMVRNCYMLQGAVLFDLGRYKDAIEAYSSVSSHYSNDPFVLETFVQIANCWRRLNRPDNARGTLQQAQIVLEKLPADADFSRTTVLSREEWRMLLTNMSRWQ